MNPEFLDRSVAHNQSVSVTAYYNKELVKIWHYHEQIEIVGIVNSTGTRFVGDNIEKYQPGEIIVIGQNLPHMWQDDFPLIESSPPSRPAEVIAIHLGNVFSRSDILSLPEYSHVRSLIEKSKQGLAFQNVNETLAKIARLPQLDQFHQLMGILEIMNELGQNKDFKTLTNKGYVEIINQPKEGRLQQVHDYIMNNFRHQVSLPAAAEIANMNASSFSRYFKQVYGTTFSQYVNKIRVGYACKLLLEDDMSIASTCFDSGFNNISNFNKQFKKIHNVSPKEYKQLFKRQ